MTKAKQKMLPGTEGTLDDVGKAAESYLEAIDKVKDAKDNAQTSQNKLAELMRAKRRRKIHVGGVTILLNHVDAQDIIKVKKSKTP